MPRLTAGRAALMLAVLTLACHLPLPFTDHVSYDDLYMMNWVSQGRFDSLYAMYAQCGGQPGYVYFSSFGWVSDLKTTFKIVGILIALATGWFTWRIGVVTGLLSRWEALFVAGVAVAFPAYKMKGGFVYSIYDLSLCLFLLATLLAVRAERRSGGRHLLLRGGALLLFALSYLMPSLLMFYGGFFWLLLLCQQKATGLPWYRLPLGFCLRRLDYLVWPFLLHGIRTVLFPPFGPYVHYNKPTLSLEAIRLGYQSLPGVILDPVRFCLSLGAPYLVALTVATLLLWLGWRVLRPSSPATEPAPEGTATPGGLFLFGTLLLLLGTAPYVAVQRTFGAWGALSTYTPLIPLPLGLILLGLGKGLGQAMPRLMPLAPAVVAAGLACCMATWWHNYLSLQAVQVRNEAFLRRLRAHPAARACTVYCIHNLCRIPRTMDNLHGWEWCFVESGISAEPRSYAYDGLPTIGFVPVDFVRKSLDETTMPFALTSINPAGKQGVLVLHGKDGFPPVRRAVRYLWLRYTNRKRVGAFLDGLVEMEFYPAPWDPARLRAKVAAHP